ncbi:MAG: sensor histidine kinase, 2 heme-binding site [Nitrospirae bacterium]|nr:sensor histidine kinase, 2 heme-binding site [Nitrospirota bacterium]
MKIREKLLFGFGFYMFLAVILGFLGYKDLQTITKRLVLVEHADDLTNTILEIRRYEKNYLLFRDTASLQEVKKYLGALQKNVENIKVEITKEIGSDHYEMTINAIADYERLFNRITENSRSQEQLGLMVRTTARNIEQRLTNTSLQKFLALRRYEKNLMVYQDAPTHKTFIDTYKTFPADKEIDNYAILVSKLYELYKDEKTSIEMLRLKAREIQSFTENLSKKERTDISAIIKKSVWMLFFALLTIIILGTIINIKLATSIALPIRKLEKITKKIASGDFSEAIEVSGRDEIASLERSFNQMEEKLKSAMDSLGKTVEMLQEKQAQLVEAEKLASIGKLAAGIAHEINNPLTSVLTFSSLLLEQCPEDDPRHGRLKMIVKETTRARNIVRHVLSFAKEAPLRTEKININQPVTEIVESLIAQEAFKGIELDLDLAKDLPDIFIDPVQIGQVVLNILLNATHAIISPGKIQVYTRAAGNFIELIVSDTGKGIPEEHLQKIFDPFFTTKDKSKGTGLGLAVSYGIIKKHGGDIEVRSTVNEGSTFIVRLPLYG